MASIQLEGVQSNVALQVETAYDALSVSERVLESARLALSLSDESMALAREGEASGSTHVVDVGLEAVRHMGATHRVRAAEHQLQLSHLYFLVYSGSSIELF